jgi:hypothetical protein
MNTADQQTNEGTPHFELARESLKMRGQPSNEFEGNGERSCTSSLWYHYFSFSTIEVSTPLVQY